jgi:hypothetical protein
MDITHETLTANGQRVLVLKANGVLAAGSEGNADAAQGLAYLRSRLEPGHDALVLDLTGLDYVWGDAIGAWWIVPARLRPGIAVRVAAGGRTARALATLIRVSGTACCAPGLSVHSTVAAALATLG